MPTIEFKPCCSQKIFFYGKLYGIIRSPHSYSSNNVPLITILVPEQILPRKYFLENIKIKSGGNVSAVNYGNRRPYSPYMENSVINVEGLNLRACKQRKKQ